MKLKNKYQRMTKDQKHALLIEYKNTEKGGYILSKLRNVFIIGILSYAYAVYMFITADKVWDYVGATSLIIAGCVFVGSSIKLKNKNLNKFAIKKK